MKLVISVLLLLSSSIQAYETALGVVTDTKWAQKDVDRSLVFVEPYNVEITWVQEGTGSRDSICAGINSQNWQTLWANISATPADLGGNPPIPNTNQLTAGTKMTFGTLEAGQRLGFKIQAPGRDGYYEVCTNPALNKHTTGNLISGWYVDLGYSHFVLFSIPDQPDYLLMIAEDYLVSYPGSYNAQGFWNATWDDQIIMVKIGAANVQASLANQGFTPVLVVESKIDKLITPMLPTVAIDPVPDTFVAYSSAINTPVTVTGSPSSYGAESLPQSTTYKLTSIQNVPTGVVPSGKYTSKLKAWNRRSSAERQANIRVNYPPVANGGSAVETGVGPVSLDASASTDQDTDQTLTFKWTQIEGLAVTIQDTDKKVASCGIYKTGKYKFRVQVSDGMNVSTADKTVNVVGPWATMAVTQVEVKGVVDASSKVVVCVNGAVASRSQNNWWYRQAVTGDGEYIMNIQVKEDTSAKKAAATTIAKATAAALKKANCKCKVKSRCNCKTPPLVVNIEDPKILCETMVRVLVGSIYGVQEVPSSNGKGVKPPCATDF